MASRNLPALVLAGLALLFADPLACLAQPAGGGEGAPPPFTALFDTAAASEPVAVLGLCAIYVALLLAWARIIRGQLVDRPSASARARWAGPIGALRTPLQATIWRETLRWFRDPRSAIELRVAYLSAIFMACIPLAVGWNQLLPFAGAILVVLSRLLAEGSETLGGWLAVIGVVCILVAASLGYPLASDLEE